tara:strand:+ start:429 stop:848 length:420 start_codon:yes stop_codon:yes gene_type:complete
MGNNKTLTFKTSQPILLLVGWNFFLSLFGLLLGSYIAIIISLSITLMLLPIHWLRKKIILTDSRVIVKIELFGKTIYKNSYQNNCEYLIIESSVVTIDIADASNIYINLPGGDISLWGGHDKVIKTLKRNKVKYKLKDK